MAVASAGLLPLVPDYRTSCGSMTSRIRASLSWSLRQPLAIKDRLGH